MTSSLWWLHNYFQVPETGIGGKLQWQYLRQVSKFSCSTYHFDVASTNHHAIHLLERKVRRLRNVVLDKSETLVLIGDWVPAKVDALDRSERQKGLLDRVFPYLEVYAAHVDSTSKKCAAFIELC